MAEPLILTNVGLAKLASATPEDQLNIASVAVGDGNGGYPPLDPTMTALVNEVWRGTASAPIRDQDNDTVLIFETIIPADDGGFFIREIGLFDDDGDMIAIGQTGVVEKPTSGSGTPITMTVRVRLALANASQTNLIINDAPYIDHQATTNRSAPDAHPIESITGLRDELDGMQGTIDGLGSVATLDVGMALDEVPTNADLFKNADLTVTVGPGGDFTTINAALAHLSRFTPLYKNNGISADIMLLSGFVMAEQVFVRGIDLGWITIKSEDDEVPIQRSALTEAIDGNRYPAFCGVQNAVLPTINALFNMDSSGTATYRHGIHLFFNSAVTVLSGCGIKNAGSDALNISRGSRASAQNSIFTGAGRNAISAHRGSFVDATGADLSGAGLRAVNASMASMVNVAEADLGSGQIDSQQGALVNADGATGVSQALFWESYLATAAEAQALTNDYKALTPAKLAAAFMGLNHSLSANGYQKLPSGLIMQWGVTPTTSIGTFNPQTVGGVTWYTQSNIITLPIAYTTRHIAVVATIAGRPHHLQAAQQLAFVNTNKIVNTPGVESLTQFTLSVTTPTTDWVPTIHWISLGV